MNKHLNTKCPIKNYLSPSDGGLNCSYVEHMKHVMNEIKFATCLYFIDLETQI